MTVNDIPAIRQRLDGVTPGPWFAINPADEDTEWFDPYEDPMVVTSDSNPGNYCAIAQEISSGARDGNANAEFIAAARQIVPDLADEVEQLRAELTKVAAAIAPTVTINPTSDAARFLHNLYQDWVKTAHERLEQVEQLRAELARADAQLIAANRRADGLHEKNAAAQNALRSLGQAYADLKTDNDDLAAENARVRQQRDEFAEALDAWAQHWSTRRENGATPAQPVDINLLAAVDALPKAEATR